MKITKEMVEKALGQRIAHSGDREVEAMRWSLEAALADVPEPGAGGLSGPEALRLRVASERYKTRAEAAEAKLAKVRERAEDIGLNESDVEYLIGED